MGLKIIITERKMMGTVNKRQMEGKDLRVQELQQQGHSVKTNLQFNVTSAWGGVTMAEIVQMNTQWKVV